MIVKSGLPVLMSMMPNARPTSCVIAYYYRTQVFEFPKAYIADADLPGSAVVMERSDGRATLVSDLLRYFREESPIHHNRICRSLRSKIGDAWAKRSGDVEANRRPLFVVVEREASCETHLEDGTCFLIDESTFDGGCAGEDAILACRVGGAPWPAVRVDDNTLVNAVLAAVKIAQVETEVIREVADSSCFHDEDGRAVCTVTGEFNLGLEVLKPLTVADLGEKAEQVRTLVSRLECERGKAPERIDNLVDALRLESIDTDHYRRAAYLALFEATKSVLEGNNRHDFHQKHRGYRKTIGHPEAGTRMDMERFRELQRDSVAQLRRVLLGD